MSFTPAHLRSDTGLSFSLFPTNLRFLRKKRGLNQEDISALFNKKPNTVGNWENGKTEPSIPELLVIAGYFGVNLEELLRSELRQLPPENDRQLSFWPNPGSPKPWASESGQRLRPSLISALNADPVSPEQGVTGAPSTHINSVSPREPVAETAPPEPDVNGNAMWFMLRELRSLNDRMDQLQHAFDQSKMMKGTDKSDH